LGAASEEGATKTVELRFRSASESSITRDAAGGAL